MQQFDLETVRHLSQLACLETDPSQLEATKADLEKILTLFEQLQEVNTDHTPPFHHTADDDQCSLRDDQQKTPFDYPLLLRNAPKRLGHLICTPPILSGES